MRSWSYQTDYYLQRICDFNSGQYPIIKRSVQGFLTLNNLDGSGDKFSFETDTCYDYS